MVKNQKALALAIGLALFASPYTASAAATGSAQSPSAASTNDGEHLDTYEIEPVTVTASGWEETAKDAPASVTVITSKEMEKKGYTDLRQVLENVEGVDVHSASTRDGAVITMRGMEPQYTLILVDGIPQNGTTNGDVNGPMGPEGYGLEMNGFMPAPSSIDRIEVVRGPMSTLYGSDAMGGVINIITKKVPKETSGNISVDHTFETDDGRADTQRYSFFIGGPITRDRVGLQLRGSWLDRGNSTLADGTTVRGANLTPPGLRSWTIGAKTTWTPSVNDTYWFDVENARQDRTSDDKAVKNAGLRYDRQRYTLGSENQTKNGKWTNSLSYNDTSMHGYGQYGTTSTDPRHDKNAIFDTKYVTNNLGAHTLTVGGRWWQEMLRGAGYYQTAESAALFAEDSWKLAPKYTFTYGLRYEHPENYEDHITPRGYLVYKADDKWTVKGGVSTGFRAPTLGQSVNGISAMTNRGRAVVYGNPNLDPEKSVSKEIGIYYGKPHGLNAHMTFFHTSYDNKIDTVSLNANGDAMYVNTGEGKTWGMEFGSKVPMAKKLDLKLNYTITNSEATSGAFKGQPLTSTPHDAVNAKLDWNPTASTNLWFGMEYRAGTPRVVASSRVNLAASGLLSNPNVLAYLNAGDYHPYSVFNLGVSHKFTKDLTMNFTINNLFDKDFSKTKLVDGVEVPLYYSNILGGRATEGTYLAGRSYWLGLSYNF